MITTEYRKNIYAFYKTGSVSRPFNGKRHIRAEPRVSRSHESLIHCSFCYSHFMLEKVVDYSLSLSLSLSVSPCLTISLSLSLCLSLSLSLSVSLCLTLSLTVSLSLSLSVSLCLCLSPPSLSWYEYVCLPACVYVCVCARACVHTHYMYACVREGTE